MNPAQYYTYIYYFCLDDKWCSSQKNANTNFELEKIC